MTVFLVLLWGFTPDVCTASTLCITVNAVFLIHVVKLRETFRGFMNNSLFKMNLFKTIEVQYVTLKTGGHVVTRLVEASDTDTARHS